MKREDIDKVRMRKNERAAIAHARKTAMRTLQHASGRSERVVDCLHETRFALARLRVCRTANPDGEVTQVGEAGFHWKRCSNSVPQFATWDEEALRELSARLEMKGGDS